MVFNLFYCGGEVWDSRPWLELTKSDAGGIAIMEKKANILPVFVEKLYCGAANILKQELLSLGGELAVHKYTVNCKAEYGDVLILATYKEYRQLYKKLAMQHWKLKELGQELKIVIDNILLTQKMQIQILDELGYSKFKDRVLDFNLTGDIIKDLSDFPLRKSDYSEDNIIVFSTQDFLDLKLLQQYILALQSKGYRILVECQHKEEKWVDFFLKPNYVYSLAVK